MRNDDIKIWVVIEILMLVGLFVSLRYLYIIENNLGCECIIGEGLYLSYIINYSKIMGIRAIDLSTLGYFVGSLIGLLAVLNERKSRLIVGIGGIVAAIIFIPYYIYLEISLGFICLYCTVLQIISILIAALFLYSIKWSRS